MELDTAKYGGLRANVNGVENGIDVVYENAEGKELGREIFEGVTDYTVLVGRVDKRLKRFWEER